MNKKTLLIVFLAAVSLVVPGPAALAQTLICKKKSNGEGPDFTFRIEKNGLRFQPQNGLQFCDLGGAAYDKIEIPMELKIQKVGQGSPPTVARVWVVEKDESTEADPAGDCSVDDTDTDSFNICGYVNNPSDGNTLTIEITRKNGVAFAGGEVPRFDVFVEDIGVIDPRIAIIDTGSLRLDDTSDLLRNAVIDVVLNELGIKLSVGEDGKSFVVTGSEYTTD